MIRNDPEKCQKHEIKNLLGEKNIMPEPSTIYHTS